VASLAVTLERFLQSKRAESHVGAEIPSGDIKGKKKKKTQQSETREGGYVPG